MKLIEILLILITFFIMIAGFGAYLEENLDNAINNCRVIESIFEQLGIHSADIKPYLENYLESFLNDDDNPSVSEFRNRLDEYLYSSSHEDEDQDN